MRRIADSWYTATFKQGRIGVRKHGKNRWGYYLRQHNGRPWPGWENGREDFAMTRESALEIGRDILQREAAYAGFHSEGSET